MFSSPRLVTLAVALSLVVASVGCGKGKSKCAQQSATQPAGPIVLNFEKCPVGATPACFTTALTGPGQPGAWIIQADPTAPAGQQVLAQTSTDPTKQRYPVCVYKDLSAQDVAVSVQFKAVAGQVDQAAGLIVRYQDKDNYYIARANALENNVRFYKVLAGKRTQIATLDAKVTSAAWHTLKLEARGAHFTVTFDGQTFTADDTTFPKAGLVGLWTKADSVTSFDDLVIK